MNTHKNLILAELNEINFDVVQTYCSKHSELTNFKKLFQMGVSTTDSERKYEDLEPWVQWVSVHTGRKYLDHKVFRLGDIVKCQYEQIFEVIESSGNTVGVLGAMNTENRLKKPTYFIPDAWTDTKSDGSLFSKAFTSVLRQTVNENTAGRISLYSLATLFITFIFKINYQHKIEILKLVKNRKNRKWYKALVLDLLISGVHEQLFRSKKTDFSTVFFNAFAHIQHHYFFSAKLIDIPNELRAAAGQNHDHDPLLDCMKVYDFIIGRLLKLNSPIIFATALSQIPYIKLKYYYRLKNHEKFLKDQNIKFKKVYPRMTRDFLINFENNDDRDLCIKALKSIDVDKFSKLFTEFEIAEHELFVTMGFPNKINEDTRFGYTIDENGKRVSEPLLPYVDLVDLKNGMHCQTGYFIATPDVKINTDTSFGNITNIHNVILNHFKN